MRLLARKPILSITLDTSSSSITTSAWRQLTASLTYACSAVEIFNPSGATIQISTGGAGSESSNIVAYTIVPGGNPFIALEIKAGKRISAKAVDQNADSGIFVMNFFG